MKKQASKFTALLLCGVLALSLTACGTNDKPAPTPDANAKPSYTAGTYTGTANGMKGEISVDVTVSADAITDVTVKSHQETYGIGYGLETSPVEVLPKQIVETQSLGVDNITGATITTAAIKNAVASAVTEAGGDAEALKNVPVEKNPEDLTLDADVVIAGAGAAGLAAGIEASRAGAKVIILEKQGVTGGATTRSGGKLLAAGTEWQKKQGYEDTPKMMLDYMKTMDGAAEQLNDEMITAFRNDSVENMTWLEDMGVMIFDVEAIHQSLTPWRVHNTTNAAGHSGGGMTDGFGGNITVPMTEEYLKNNGEIYYNTTAETILTDADGAIVGLSATKADGSKLTVNAKNVILATGGYAQNKEMMQRYAESTEGFVTSVPAGNLGDGLTMGKQVNAQIFDAPATQTVYLDFNSGVGINEEAGLIVNAEGKRVTNEYTYQYHVGNALAKSGSSYGWYLATANDTTPTVQYAMSLEKTIKANSIEELAKLMEVDAAELQATIDRYNELCASGKDEDFGKPAEHMMPVEGETYFALKLRPSVTVTFGGLVTDVQAQVLDTENNPIPGLYAAGEVAFTGLFGDEYPCCGMAIGGAVYFGRIAGQQAAANK